MSKTRTRNTKTGDRRVDIDGNTLLFKRDAVTRNIEFDILFAEDHKAGEHLSLVMDPDTFISLITGPSW